MHLPEHADCVPSIIDIDEEQFYLIWLNEKTNMIDHAYRIISVDNEIAYERKDDADTLAMLEMELVKELTERECKALDDAYLNHLAALDARDAHTEQLVKDRTCEQCGVFPCNCAEKDYSA